MPFSYKPLWKLLIDRDMSKKALMEAAKISKSIIDKMGYFEIVSFEMIDRICNHFDGSIEDIIEHCLREGGQNGN